MKNYLSVLFIAIITFVVYFPVTSNVSAQSEMYCGDVIQSEFRRHNEKHEYRIDPDDGVVLVIYTEVTSRQTDLKLETGFTSPNGFVLDELIDGNSFWATTLSVVVAGELEQQGYYTFSVYSYTTNGGQYTVNVACVDANGEVISGTQYVNQLRCGSIIENEFSMDRIVHRYYGGFSEGDSVTITAEVVGTQTDLEFETGFNLPGGYVFDELIEGNSFWASTSQTIGPFTITQGGTHRYTVFGYTQTGGQYTVFVRCVLADGTVIEPGMSINEPTAVPTVVDQTYSEYGFPGVPFIDFSSGIEIPLQLNQVQTTPIANDIVLYNYDADAGEVVTLRIDRVSGDVSVGITVINNETYDILFFGGLLSSDNLSVELLVPTDGTYTIGLYPLDSFELSGNSGAVQTVIEGDM